MSDATRPVRALCGTTSGRYRHQSLGESPCADCKAAWAAYMREWYSRNADRVSTNKRERYNKDPEYRYRAIKRSRKTRISVRIRDGFNDPPQPRACEQCGELFTPKQRDNASGDRPTRFCGRACKDQARLAAQRAERLLAKAERPCAWCCEPIPKSMRSDAKFCSSVCNQRAHGTTRTMRRRLGQMEKRRNTQELVSLGTIGDRDGWRCGLCHKKINRSLRHPHPRAASIDHIVPVSVALALGWSENEVNGLANLQVVHFWCNWSKRERPRGEQLRLIG